MLNLYLSENDYDGMTPKEREIYEDLLEYRRKKEGVDEKDEDSHFEEQDRFVGDTFCEAVVCDIFSAFNSIYFN